MKILVFAKKSKCLVLVLELLVLQRKFSGTRALYLEHI